MKPTQLTKGPGVLRAIRDDAGLGYDVEALSERLTEALGTARLQPVILVGVGKPGGSAAALRGICEGGIRDRGGLRRRGIAEEGGGVAGAAAGNERAAGICRGTGGEDGDPGRAGDGGAGGGRTNWCVRGYGDPELLPILLQVPDGVVVNNVDLALELENLSYFIR